MSEDALKRFAALGVSVQEFARCIKDAFGFSNKTLVITLGALDMEIKLGSKVRDMVTGVTGIAVARCEYLNSCVQYCLVPPAKKGATECPEGVYLDVGQLEVVGNGINIPQRPTGGPQVDVPRA